MFPCPLVAWLQNSCCGDPHPPPHQPHFPGADMLGNERSKILLRHSLQNRWTFLLITRLDLTENICFLRNWGFQNVPDQGDLRKHKSRRSAIAFPVWKSQVYEIDHRLDQQVLKKIHNFENPLFHWTLWHGFQDRPTCQNPTDNYMATIEVAYCQGFWDKWPK